MESLKKHGTTISKKAKKYDIVVLTKEDSLKVTCKGNKVEIGYKYDSSFSSFSFEIKNAEVRKEILKTVDTLTVYKDDVLHFMDTIFLAIELVFAKEIPNVVTDKFKRDPITLEFLVQTSFASLSSSRRDTIYNPKCSIDYNILMTEVGKYGNISSMAKLIEVIKKADTDSDLLVLVGPKVYEFLKFVVESNKTDMVSSEIEFITTVEQKNGKGGIIKSNYYKKEEGIQTFAIRYPSYIEDKFNVSDPEYFFHGSGIENWHSILRNGIKNASGTKLQVNGAAYGSGVYLGTNAGVSYGYCRGQIIAMGVVQVLDDYKKWMKNGNSFLVVRDDSVLLLRYIIFFKGTGSTKYSSYGSSFDPITKYFRETLKYKKSAAMSSLGMIAKKRVRGEIKRVDMKLKEKVKLESNGSDVSNLIATMTFPENKVKKIKVAIKLPDDFPASPPKIALRSPKLSGLTDMVTSSGGIIMKKLCGNAWKPSNTFWSMFSDIYEHFLVKNYSEGSSGTYDFDKAIESFYEVQKTKGWH